MVQLVYVLKMNLLAGCGLCAGWMTVAGPAVWKVVEASSALITVFTFKPFQTATEPGLLVALTSHRALPVTPTLLAAPVGIVVPSSLNTFLALGSLRQARTDTAPGVRVTDVAGLRAGRTFLTSSVGDAPVTNQTGVTPGTSHPGLADTLARHVVTVVVFGAHGVTVTLGAAPASLNAPVAVLALVTHPTLHLTPTLTDSGVQVTLLRHGAGGMTAALSTATAGEPVVERLTPIANYPRNPGPTLTLAGVSVTEGSHGANIVTVALSAPGSDGSKAVCWEK